MKSVFYNQKALNEILGLTLSVDGIDGPKTINAENLFINKLQKIFTTKGYKLKAFEPIGIRMNDSYTDKFTDWCFILLPDNECCFIPHSTKPASAAEKDNNVACLKEGQYINAWQYRNDGWTKLPYLHQVKNVTIYRDTLYSLKLERDSTIQVGLFGINWHSWLNWVQNILWYKSTNRDVCLSEGCQVQMAEDLKNLFFGNLNRKYVIGDFVTCSLIQLEDFK